MQTLDQITTRFGCSEAQGRQLLALQSAGLKYGRLGYWPDGDFGSDADWCYGPGALIDQLDEALGIDDFSVFDLWLDGWSEGIAEHENRIFQLR